jgi:hypothetical protein
MMDTAFVDVLRSDLAAGGFGPEPRLSAVVSTLRQIAALPGAALVLRGLTAFEPTRRLSMRQLLRAELFAPYRAPYVAPSAGARRPERTMSFLGYLDDARDGAEEAGAALQLPPKPKPAAAQRGKRGGR